MKKPPSARSRKIAYIVIAVLYGALIAMYIASDNLAFAALFLAIGLFQHWDVLSAWYRRRKSPSEPAPDSGTQ